jgi:hypothetical protein
MVSDVGGILGPVTGVVMYELTGRVTFALLGAFSGLLLVAVLARPSGQTTLARTPEIRSTGVAAVQVTEPDGIR